MSALTSSVDAFSLSFVVSLVSFFFCVYAAACWATLRRWRAGLPRCASPCVHVCACVRCSARPRLHACTAALPCDPSGRCAVTAAALTTITDRKRIFYLPFLLPFNHYRSRRFTCEAACSKVRSGAPGACRRGPGVVPCCTVACCFHVFPAKRVNRVVDLPLFVCVLVSAWWTKRIRNPEYETPNPKPLPNRDRNGN